MPAQILCVKCGAVSPQPRQDCPKCGGRNARVCGSCGNQNSLAKNFCDKCGAPISELTQTPPPPKTVLPGSASQDIPATMVRKLPPSAPPPAPAPPPAAAPLPPPGRAPAEPAPRRELDDLWTAPAAQPSLAPEPAPSGPNRWRAALNVAAALAGVAGAAYGIWSWRVERSPQVAVPKLAARYLEDLRVGDVNDAYAMFSDAAKKYCSLDEFRASRATETWTWSDLRIEHVEPGAVLMAYELEVAGDPPRVDHLLFTEESGRWTRPYNWTLMRKVETAFDNDDPDKGLILAQAAATVDPRDPMAWGYLCEAAYYRKAPAVAQSRCEKAIELARTYPSDLTLKSLYHLHAILADIENNALHQPEKALEQFAEMLSFPEISPADQCQILLARSQTYIALSRPGEALADLDRGAQLCTAPSDLQFIRNQRRDLDVPGAQ